MKEELKAMRTMKEQAPEILELSVKADIIATVFADIASLKDPTLTSRDAIREKVRSVKSLIDQLNTEYNSLMET